MDNYLITGYWGEPHVTAENDRGFNAAVFGAGRFVLPVGERLRAEYIGNNTIRLYDGKLLDNGALAGIPAGKYVDLQVPEAGQGRKRNDLIVFQYKKNASTLVETGEFVVVRGTETAATVSDPHLSQQDILTDNATLDQMALYRVSVNGATIGDPEPLFETAATGGKLELLWQNASPSSEFASQTVELTEPVKNYSMFIVGFHPGSSTSTSNKDWRIYAAIPFLESHTLQSWAIDGLLPSGANKRFFMVYVEPNGIYFNSCSYDGINLSTGETTKATMNSRMIPCEIYGIKGGKAT